MKVRSLLLGLWVGAVSVGCAVEPASPRLVGAEFRGGESIATQLNHQSAPGFPARIAMVRIQSVNRGDGQSVSDRYVVLTHSDAAVEDDLRRIASLEGVAATMPMARMVLPARLMSLRDLRFAAAKLNANVLLVYTVNTDVEVHRAPWTLYSSLLLEPLYKRDARLNSVVSGLLVDVKTGGVYGAVDGSTASQQVRGSVLSVDARVEASSAELESIAFHQFLMRFEQIWMQLYTHSREQAGNAAISG